MKTQTTFISRKCFIYIHDIFIILKYPAFPRVSKTIKYNKIHQIKRSRNWHTRVLTDTPERNRPSHDQSDNKTLQNLEIKKIKTSNPNGSWYAIQVLNQ